MSNKLVAIVGMCGSGKSVLADALVAEGYGYLRFGQIVLDEVKRRGLPPTEPLEREIRENFRKEHGMGAFAILNIPKFDELLKNGNTVGDGMYSWDEYKILRERYGKNFITVAIYAPPQMRYERLEKRFSDANDTDLRNRGFSREAAAARDQAEIENSAKGGPIAMADYTIVNAGTVEEYQEQIKKVIEWLKTK
ncbi:MAG: AAA family ATPase [Patescibacteria group bacterium]|jgi:dephospho-CoA kinase